MPRSPRAWKTDCRWFRGERPCVHKRECEGCELYDPVGPRVLVLKIAALGDVLRTTPVLGALQERLGNPHVTWLVGSDAEPLLRGHPRIDRLLVPGWEASEALAVESFDLVLSLDKDPYSTAIATRIEANEKRGFGRDGHGALVPLHESAQYAYDLGLSDQLKFRENEKTYQQITFEVCGLEWNGHEYDVPVGPRSSEEARAVLDAAGIGAAGGPVVGFNTGAGDVFANKAWTIEGYAELASRLAADGCRVVLLGGTGERERNEAIRARAGSAARDVGSDHDLRRFAGLVAACDLVVTGDTLGMHLAIAAQVPVVVMFGSTCPQEIELYGRGEKVVTPIECHPCYLHECDVTPSCQDRISVDLVLGAVQRTLSSARK